MELNVTTIACIACLGRRVSQKESLVGSKTKVKHNTGQGQLVSQTDAKPELKPETEQEPGSAPESAIIPEGFMMQVSNLSIQTLVFGTYYVLIFSD